MGSNVKTVARNVAEKLAAENPKVATRTLARMLRNDHPEMFHSIDHARTTLRTIRGNHGSRNRKDTADKSLYRENAEAGWTGNLPSGMRQGHPEFQISGPAKILVISDVHVPYHDERALAKAIDKGVQQGCDTLYINGDLTDFYAISRWQKDPSQRDLCNEVYTTRDVLAEIGSPFKRRILKKGNHDERWELYMFNHAPDLVELDDTQYANVLRLEKNGFELVESMQWALFGKYLYGVHGHEFPRGLSSPVNPARGLYLKLNQIAFCGHMHRTSNHNEPQSISQEIMSCWSHGCLCDMRPHYAPLNKWNLGFAIIDLDKDGQFEFSNYKITADSTKVFKS